MEEIKQMVDALWLTDKIYWDIALYWIFFVNLIILFILPSGSSLQTTITIVVLLCVVIDKVYAFGYMFDSGRYTPVRCHETIFFGTYIIRILMLVAPLTVAGSTDSDKVRGIAILAGISGGVYAFARWYAEQRDVSSTALTCAFLDVSMVAQNAGLALILAKMFLRDRLSLGAIHRHGPVTVLVELAPDEVEVQVA
ncbi:hypothetical protein [Aggregatilinea lenta]|uniref:hypothetical protein n=1 Tax=Aggregatilinea lenta TaxID=913108 RepID=UPI000E5AEE22|nr:hypothetical protein [Aggregatilinea lenta]